MGVKGTLEDMSLTGLISINCNEGNQAKLRVQHNGDEAYIYFEQGQIAHIEMDDRVGEEVMQELLMWDRGEFELDLDVPPPAHTVETPWFNLVLDGMRVMDEDEDEVFDGTFGTAFELDAQDGLEAEPQAGPAGAGPAGAGFVNAHAQTATVADLFKEENDTMAELRDLLKEMAGEVQGFVAAAVSGVDGLSIAEYSASPDFNLEVATAQFALVMKLVQKNVDRLESGVVEDNLVTTDTNYILSRFLGDDYSYYLVVSVDRDMASLGNARLMVRNFAPDLWDAIPRRG
jgi:predicted regulator of Ras-like GTPase activity (Roadblock/LC7/MglB family)